ncbi:MAG: dihydroneopterin aldolase [Candidatus Hydrogenedentota bacterium]
MAERPLDIIRIDGLLVRCIVGVHEEERTKRQDVILHIALHADLRAPCGNDRIEETVDYKGVKKAVFHLVENSSFYLIERLAEAVAQCCLEHRPVQRVEVQVEKPGALRFAQSVSVEIVRERNEPGC